MAVTLPANQSRCIPLEDLAAEPDADPRARAEAAIRP